jgi:hypothetical protein
MRPEAAVYGHLTGTGVKGGTSMIKEIRFLVTKDIRKPKRGDWFLNPAGVPVCASQDFLTSKHPILEMVVIDERENSKAST